MCLYVVLEDVMRDFSADVLDANIHLKVAKAGATITKRSGEKTMRLSITVKANNFNVKDRYDIVIVSSKIQLQSQISPIE